MVARFAIVFKKTSDEIIGLNIQTEESAHSLRIMKRVKKIEALSEVQAKANTLYA